MRDIGHWKEKKTHLFLDDSIKNPCFLRREGRRKRKAGAKNEKAIKDYSPFLKEVKENLHKYQRKIFTFLAFIDDSNKVTKLMNSLKTA